jgi:hypothetical protein
MLGELSGRGPTGLRPSFYPLFTQVPSTTSLTPGEPLEKSFFEWLISSKSRSMGPDFVAFRLE